MENEEIRSRAAKAGVKLWQIAEIYGLNDGNFSRKLRHKLTRSERQKILAIISQIASGGEESD